MPVLVDLFSSSQV